MQYVDLPRYGPCNIDTIQAVRWAPAKWRNRRDRHAYRPFIWWGKPRRSNGASFGAWLEKAEVRIHFTGSDYPTCMQCENDKAANKLCGDIEAAIRGAREHGVERIVAAAVQRTERDRGARGGQADIRMTFTLPSPARHHNIIQTMPLGDPVQWTNMTQGFLTSTGRFVSRKEAMGIAVAAGQVPPSKVERPDLYSEDVW